jgi:quercetin dioxygenase-like cupin family protein
MKRFSLYLALVLVGLIFFGATQAPAQKKMKKQPILWAAEDIKWDTLKGSPPGSGVMGAVLWGNLEKGPFGVLIKFPPGFKTPLHHHSSDLKGVVIKGAYIYVSENGAEKRCGPGSYLYEPSGDRHATRGAEDSETIFYTEGNKKFDVVPEKEGMGEKK